MQMTIHVLRDIKHTSETSHLEKEMVQRQHQQLTYCCTGRTRISSLPAPRSRWTWPTSLSACTLPGEQGQSPSPWSGSAQGIPGKDPKRAPQCWICSCTLCRWPGDDTNGVMRAYTCSLAVTVTSKEQVYAPKALRFHRQHDLWVKRNTTYFHSES